MFSNNDLIEAVAQRSFASIGHLETVMDEEYDEPWFSTGKFGIVFRLTDPKSNKQYALKVFKERDLEKEERLKQIAEQIAAYPSHYWVSYEFLEDEIQIESPYGETEHACAILMEWIEGKTMGEYVKECCEDQDQVSLYKLAYTFDQMALWLLANPFAHGDLKHDNIIIKPSGLPVLVDYDGMYFPIFSGQISMELGTPDYQHPRRKEKHFGSYLDDFSMLVISLGLHALAHEPGLHYQYNTGENLILGVSDFLNSQESKLLDVILSFEITDIHQRLALFDYAITLTCQSVAGIDTSLRSKIFYFNRLKELVNGDASSNLIPYRKGDKWGLANKRKKIIVPCVYNSIEINSDGIFIVERNKRFGLINEKGIKIASCKFLNSDINFSEGLARVKKHSGWGFIDKNGKESISFIYEKAENFSEGLAVVKLFDEKGYGYINKEGTMIIPNEYEFASSFKDGYSEVNICEFDAGNLIEINSLSAVEFSCDYNWIQDLSSELAGVEMQNKWSLINKITKQLYLASFDSILPFREGLAQVSIKGEGVGFINEKSEIVIPCIYASSGMFYFEGNVAVKKKEEKWGIINKIGKLIFPFICEEVRSFHNGFSIIQISSKFGFINLLGEVVVPCEYEMVECFTEELAAVRLNKKWGFINHENKIVIPCEYDGVGNFSEGLAAVRLDEKSGFINSKNKIIIPRIYDNVRGFQHGLAKVRQGENWGYIDRKGVEYWES